MIISSSLSFILIVGGVCCAVLLCVCCVCGVRKMGCWESGGDTVLLGVCGLLMLMSCFVLN